MANVLKVKETDKIAAFGPPEDFTGELITYRKSGELMRREQFQDGKPHGQQCYLWQNGIVSSIGYAREGKCVGVWLYFMDIGILTNEVHYSSVDGHFTKRWYDPWGRVKRIELYRNGVEVMARDMGLQSENE